MALIEPTTISILYRGPLSSCNYECSYCPFAKHAESREELDHDRACLERFVAWTKQATRVDSVFFTPWGEALIRPWYHQAFEQLGNLPHIRRVAAQTNLAYNPSWLASCNRSKIGLWCTYHPAETDPQLFLSRCSLLDGMNIRYSVGAVGMRDDISRIERMRESLRSDVYLWVNAYKRETGYYTDDDVQRLTRIDPLFPLNMLRYRSMGRACNTGHHVISVDGAGDVRRCHFIPDVLGNIYNTELNQILFERPCTAARCGCHIGYAWLDDLGLNAVYRDGILERIPGERLWQSGTDAHRQAAAFVERALARESDPTSLTIRQVSISGT